MIYISAPMTSDKVPVAVKLGDIVWTYDVFSDMKVPMEVKAIYEDGSWDGTMAWTWGLA